VQCEHNSHCFARSSLSSGTIEALAVKVAPVNQLTLYNRRSEVVRYYNDNKLAIPGWSSSVARWAHNPKVTGSNPVPGTQDQLFPRVTCTFVRVERQSFIWKNTDSHSVIVVRFHKSRRDTAKPVLHWSLQNDGHHISGRNACTEGNDAWALISDIFGEARLLCIFV
jgi:hypothetical protein